MFEVFTLAGGLLICVLSGLYTYNALKGAYEDGWRRGYRAGRRRGRHDAEFRELEY